MKARLLDLSSSPGGRPQLDFREWIDPSLISAGTSGWEGGEDPVPGLLDLSRFPTVVEFEKVVRMLEG
jgi:hypothetical protein